MTKKSHEMEIFTEGMPPAMDSGLFGLTGIYEESDLVILPVPWDATASYGKGTAHAAKGILKASHQLDLVDLKFGKPYERGIFLLDADERVSIDNEKAGEFIETIRHGRGNSKDLASNLKEVNECSERVNRSVEFASKTHLDNNKFVAVLGGDHSSPFGLVKALAEKHQDFGILHIDAHFDLRKAYEGFAHSHASIMYNILGALPQVTNLVQVGIRDFCAFEQEETYRHGSRVSVFYDSEMFASKCEGDSFKNIAHQIVAKLPNKVYVSFDIDGLSPSYCPGTGTPVPGGLDYHEAFYLLEVLAFSGKKIIGFDLCEVAGDSQTSEWDFNVGARVLYKLCGALFHTQLRH
ncbi:MAG: agmatinase family protein [Oligoflexales bacterium]